MQQHHKGIRCRRQIKWLNKLSLRNIFQLTVVVYFSALCLTIYLFENSFPTCASRNNDGSDENLSVWRRETWRTLCAARHSAHRRHVNISFNAPFSISDGTLDPKSYPLDKLFQNNNRRVTDVNCVRFIKYARRSYRKYRQKPINLIESFQDITENCTEYVTSRAYITHSLTEEEKNFPIAFSILVYKDLAQVERLLRAIYRPEHYYCIHIDQKSDIKFKTELYAITRCFPNVFITPKSVDVRWGTFTVLEPELICLRSLWKFRKWKYFINLTGMEFPLKTNYELVKILKAYNGANDLNGDIKRPEIGRWRRAGLPPHNLRPVKGSVQMVVNRAFVDYALHNPIAQDLLEWVKKIRIPDEEFFTTLNFNPQLKIPGTYKGYPDSSDDKPFLARYKHWYGGPCNGKHVRGFCIFGIGDLPRLTSAKHLFANKFHLYYQPIAYDCLEEWNFNRTRDYYYGKLQFDDSFYRALKIVKNKVS